LRRLLALALFLALASSAAAGTVRGRVVVKDKGGKPAADLSDVVVWIEGGKPRAKPAPVKMTMKNKQFVPHVVVVPVGGSVEFPNEDPIFHNVFSVSGENRFDLALYKRPKSGTWTFQKPGVVRVYCNIHPQMSAVVVVRDGPHFVKSAADGAFVMEGVPAGKHVIRAWHERAGEATLEVTVPADGAVSADLTLDASSFKRVQHKNKFGKDYESSDKY
jgi:plastocyanin